MVKTGPGARRQSLVGLKTKRVSTESEDIGKNSINLRTSMLSVRVQQIKHIDSATTFSCSSFRCTILWLYSTLSSSRFSLPDAKSLPELSECIG